MKALHVTLLNQAGALNMARGVARLDDGQGTEPPPLLMGDRGEWKVTEADATK
ncbi:hypothetical protein QBC31_42945 [Streptomyces sp. B21-079]|uniref:hypothetical protein n=1 Tax=Streptomyces sp. B21-079 TaxID=3039409 RepID=UPI002FF2A550